MDKLELLAVLRAAHDEIGDAIAALSDEDLAGLAWEGWTRRDVVAHVEWWERHSCRVLTALRAGGVPYDRSAAPDTDAQNAQVLAESRGRTAADVRAGEAAAWAELQAALEDASDADLFEPDQFDWTGGEQLAEEIHWDTDRHWAEHLPALLVGPAG